MPESQYLIVGQGIAGTSLAWELLRRGQKFLVIDDPALPSSSLVAAGIFNPLTGRKLVKTWLADTIFPHALAFYRQVEAELGITCLHTTDLFRPYRNEEEKTSYLKWAASDEYAPFVASGQPDFSNDTFIRAPYNGLSVSRSGWVDLPRFLENSRNYFEKLGCFEPAHFRSQDLDIGEKAVEWLGRSFEKVILCMGVGAENDPLFNWLPFNPVKGQILNCRIERYPHSRIINQGIFILPAGNEKVRVGATYSWHDLDWEPTEDGRDYLTGKLENLLKVPFEIESQVAGIRPSSRDRRPFTGRHPEHDRLFIFNGLGTKGVTLAPYFAAQLVKLLLDGQEIMADANIGRYFSLYSNPRKP